MLKRKSHIILFTIVLLLSTKGFAQKTKVKNLPRFYHRHIHFGFLLGINSADFSIDRKAPQPGDSLLSLQVKKQSGFDLGIISELHFNDYFRLRFTPTISFAQRNLDYKFMMWNKKTIEFVKPVESTYLEFPLLFKLNSARVNNFSAYIITGGKYTLDLASNASSENTSNVLKDQFVSIAKNDYDFEAGFGTEFYLEYFKFGIELKMSYGLNNILIRDNPPTIFSTPIDRIRSKMFLLSFTFEG